jgi:hypothetical protein
VCPPSAGQWELEAGTSVMDKSRNENAAKIAIVHLYTIKQKKDGRVKLIGYRCGCSAFRSEPGLFLCKNCKAAEDAGAELRIYARLKKYRGVEIEIGEFRSKKALLECAMKLIRDREREEATVGEANRV